MTIEEQIAMAKEDGLIDEDGSSNVFPLQDMAQDAYLKAEYNSVLLEILMEE